MAGSSVALVAPWENGVSQAPAAEPSPASLCPTTVADQLVIKINPALEADVPQEQKGLRRSSSNRHDDERRHPRHHRHHRHHDCEAPDADIESLEEGHFLSSVPEIALPEFPRSHNTPQEIIAILSGLGYKKSSTDGVRTFLLGTMAGFWVALAGILASSAAGGVPAEMRDSWPALPRFLAAIVFPVGIIFEVLFGGELFTGNNMILFVSWYSGRISKRTVASKWTVVWFGNLAGALATLFLFAWLPELFRDEPYKGFVIASAEARLALSYWIVFLRSVPANVLVCLSIYLGLMARDILGKAFGMYVPVFVFVATAMEHCVADMYFVPMGMLLGANVSVVDCICFLLTCTAGNIVGGALLVGGSLWYMHGRNKSAPVTREQSDEK